MASFYDSFQRADNPASLGTSDSGVTWTTLAGTFGILAGQAYNPSGALSHATVDLGMSDCAVRWTLPTEQTASAVLIRCTNVNNLYYLRVNGGAYTLSKIVAGVFTQLVTGTLQSHSGDTLTVVCNGPKITWYVNGVLDTTWSDAFNQTETHFGVRCQDTNTRYSRMAAQALRAGGATWYVTPSGNWFGDGSLALPWDFRTAMASVTGIVSASDTVYVRGGNYETSGNPPVDVTLGTAVGPAVNVRRYPGDTWPRIYIGLWLRALCPGYVNFWGLQFLQDNIQRINNYRHDNPSYGDSGVILEAPNCQTHYCIVANNAAPNSAYFYGEQAIGSLVHMNLIYYNGFRDVFNGLPAGQAFYRQADDAGTQVYQTIDTCISCLNWQTGMQMQGGAAAHFAYAKTLNSLWFYGGYLGASYAAGQAIREILLGYSSASPTVHADQIYFDQNWCWPQPGSNHQQAVQLGYNNPDNTFVSWTNNRVQGYLTLKLFRNVEFYGNLQARETFNGLVSQVNWQAPINAYPSPVGLGYDHNAYYQGNDGVAGLGHFPFQSDNSGSNHEYKTVPLWNATTGYDAHSTLASYSAVPIQVGVYRNTYEPSALWPTPRAFVYVFNFQGASTASIDVSGCTGIGDSWAIYDWGQYELDSPTPIATGVYLGSPITLSLGVQSLPTLIADPVGARSQHDPLPTIPAGQPGAYIYAITSSGTPVTPIDTESPISGVVTFPGASIAAGGLKVGDRYYVCHSADLVPEKYGRQALTAGIWQGGDVSCSVVGAYPDAIGPFYLLKTLRTGTARVDNHAWEQLAYDANVRRTS